MKSKLGDVFEIEIDSKVFHVQYIQKHPTYGPVVRIFPRAVEVGSLKLKDIPQMVAEEYTCSIFFDAPWCAKLGEIRLIGNRPVSEKDCEPIKMIMPGAYSPGPWRVFEGETERIVDALSETEKLYPENFWIVGLSGLIRVVRLIHRDGPTWQRNAMGRADEYLKHPPTTKPTDTTYFLQFKSEDAARRASLDPLLASFENELRRSDSDEGDEDEDEWLLQVVTHVPRDNFAAEEKALSELARRYGGELDGWEHPA